jgi:ribosome-binding factor A
MSVARVIRLNELVKRALSVIIEREFTHADVGWVTLSRVVVSKDLQHARVFFTVLGGPDQEQHALERLRHAQAFIRAQLAHAVRMRYTPALIFEIDEELKTAMRVDALLNRLTPGEQPAKPPQ